MDQDEIDELDYDDEDWDDGPDMDGYHEWWDDDDDDLYDIYDEHLEDLDEPSAFLFTMSEFRWRVRGWLRSIKYRLTRCKDCGKLGTVDGDYCSEHRPIPF